LKPAFLQKARLLLRLLLLRAKWCRCNRRAAFAAITAAALGYYFVNDAPAAVHSASASEPPSPVHHCESAVLNHFAITAFCTLRNHNWIQLLFRKVQNAVIAKWLSTALSQMDPVIVPQSAKCCNSKMVKHCALTDPVIVPQSAKCCNSKMVKHCALTIISIIFMHMSYTLTFINAKI
jgi:hypothetical protein